MAVIEYDGYKQKLLAMEPQLDEPWVKQLHDDFLAFCKLEHEEKGEPIVQAFLNTTWDYGE